MLKLYRKSDGRVTHYHEAWVDGAAVTEHWGPVGERGESKDHKRDKKLSDFANIDLVLAAAKTEGFQPIDMGDHAMMLVEYPVNGAGTGKDVKKRHAVEERLSETLGWTGLGMCDGGSIGSGTMEVACFVVDFDVAKRVIETDLKGTKFGDYSRIYQEGAK